MTNDTALILVDLQEGILELPTVPYTSETLLKHAKIMTDAFRKAKLPIIFVRVKFHDGKDKLAPNASKPLPGQKDLEPHFSKFPDFLTPQKEDIIIDKKGFSGFFGTELDLQLRRRGIKTIVLGGVSTHIAIDSTARDAYQYGYNQYFITDMMAATSLEAHHFPIEYSFPLMGQCLSHQEFLKHHFSS